MEPVPRHTQAADVRFDGGTLDCGSGLLLLLREHIDPLPRGGLIEVLSRETSVEEDLPAWCRLTGNALLSFTRSGLQRSFLICKGALAERSAAVPVPQAVTRAAPSVLTAASAEPRAATPAPAPPALSVMGVGSWPRPRWLVAALHEHLEGRLPEAEFEATADDAVRLAVTAQERAGADVVTDGEQRRDSYANFVGRRLDGCRSIPLTDLLPLVEHPEELEEQFRSLDVPAAAVRHPAVVGPLGRSRPIAVHELRFARTLTARPLKVALPGPYLLSRVMWMECLSDRAYATQAALADAIVGVLHDEVAQLLAEGAALVQLDEPVLTEVVHGRPAQQRSFMCGVLSERGDPRHELERAVELVNRVVAGLPPANLALHVCRGNWTPDETAALAGGYAPLVEALGRMQVGTLVLELCTPRAGELDVLRALPDDRRIGVGVVNPKAARVEPVEEILGRARRAIDLLGRERVLLNPDCGFATFADNPVASAAVAEAKLAAVAEASRRLRGG